MTMPINEFLEARIAEDRGVEVCNDCGDWFDGSPIDYPCETVEILAAVYKDHPDYRQQWAA